MFLVSDNTGPVHPSVLEALTRANEAYVAGYGADDASARAVQAIRDLFEAPEAAVHLVATGTAANSLILASMAQPWSTIFCAPMAHIQEDECNAPEFFSGGAKLTLVEAENAKITPAALRAAIAAEQTRGVHGPKRGPVSITNATEKGTVYSPAEVAALAEVTREYGLPLHMDGARFSNAVAALGCGGLLAELVVDADPGPAFQPGRLALGQACAHGEIGFGKVQRVFVFGRGFGFFGAHIGGVLLHQRVGLGIFGSVRSLKHLCPASRLLRAPGL